MRWSILCLISVMPCLAASGPPVEQTPYGKSIFRIEARPGPQQMKDAGVRRSLESALAEAGVDGRWISIVDPVGRPYLANRFLPPVPDQDLAENEAILKAWVAEMHANGQAVMSWYALSIGQSANLAHPDWRQVSVVPWYRESEASLFCCHMTGYGDAMINYCIEAIGRLDLDGIWFDGAAWTPIWNRPLPITCFCDACRSGFRSDTGLELPTVLSLDNGLFRTWVAWRYGRFSDFIQTAARRIRTSCPDVAIVINHYHRPGVPWHSAIAVDRYDADVITGSEAFSPVTLDLTQRLNRAYGRGQSEVWRPFELAATSELTADNLLPHALHSYAAGGRPSFGGDHTREMMGRAAALMSPVMKAVTPYVGGPALPHLALHVSQQSETFVFARGGDIQNPSDFFWNALGTWNWALVEAHLPPDFVFDVDFTTEKLTRYAVLLMPLSPALSGSQIDIALDYCRRGGVLVLGPGAGQKDKQGEVNSVAPLERALGFQFTSQLDPQQPAVVATRFKPVAGGVGFLVNGVVTPAEFSAPEWKPLFVNAEGGVGIAERPFGAGRVVLVTADPSLLLGPTPVAGGDTQLRVTDEEAATGKFSLKFSDGAVAAQPFYPDLENKLTRFGTLECTGGLFECDLLLKGGASVVVELRSAEQPILGPSVRITPDGVARLSNGGTVRIPVGEWSHLAIDYDFADGDKMAPFRVQVSRPEGVLTQAAGSALQPGYRMTDWLVIFGPDAQVGTWYIDNVSLSKKRSDGGKQRVMLLDFETGEDSLQNSGALAIQVAELLKDRAPPSVTITAPPAVHAGVFEPAPGRVLVHLYSTDQVLADWLQPTGHTVTLSCAFRPVSVRLPLVGETLVATRAGDRWLVEVPHMGLYQVVELAR